MTLTYGSGADWVKKVAAGGGAIEYGGEDHIVTNAPMERDLQAAAAFGGWARVFPRLVRVSEYPRMEVEP